MTKTQKFVIGICLGYVGYMAYKAWKSKQTVVVNSLDQPGMPTVYQASQMTDQIAGFH